MSTNSTQNLSISGNNLSMPLINFQLDKLSIKEKSDFNWGFQLSQYIESLVNGGSSSYFWVRNQRWKTNRNYANGRINMSRFQDLMEFNGKVNYINLNWQCIHIVNRIISGLVGRWMTRSEKASVTATDPLSAKEKQEEFERLEFYIENREQLEKLQQESGVPMLPQNEEIPTDKEQLLLWRSQFQRLPEEILNEMGANDILAANGWFDTLKEKMLHDSAETGFVATYTWMDSEGVVHVEWLKPENCFYSYSNYPDFRDTSWRGYMRTLKISELRKRYGREFHPNDPNSITEEQLFQMAQTAKEYQLYDNITWITEWNVTFLRPYDEWNVDIIEFELKTIDSESYTEITTKANKSLIVKKGKPNRAPKENERIVDDSRINIYRGVYARNNQIMLEWGLKENMIRPQDPKEMGNAEFSYSFYMVQNYDMTCLGVPEKIQEPADQMIIARLKIQQLVANMIPAGAAINWDAIQNIDYGLGDQNKAIDVQKLYQQTGKLYWRGRDAEGNPVPVPIIELQNAGFITQMQGLMELYRFHYQVMKDELGEDPNLISQAVQPRVAVQNIETSQQQAEYATDYYYSAYIRCMEDTVKKISCLLKDSITYGAQVYRHLLKEEDVAGRIFSTKIQLLPDAFAIQRFEALLNQAIMANPELIQFLDPFQVMRIAKEDVKLAEIVFRQAQKRMLQHRASELKQNQEATFQSQIASAQASEQAKGKNLEMELKMKGEQAALQGKIDKEKITLQGVFELAKIIATPKPASETGQVSQGGEIPPSLKELMELSIKNIAIPLAIANQNIVDEVTEPEQNIQQNQPQEAA